MTLILKFVCYGALGGFLAFMGHSFRDWQYWIVMALVIVIDILSELRVRE